jgi:hypothetical protein
VEQYNPANTFLVEIAVTIEGYDAHSVSRTLCLKRDGTVLSEQMMLDAARADPHADARLNWPAGYRALLPKTLKTEAKKLRQGLLRPPPTLEERMQLATKVFSFIARGVAAIASHVMVVARTGLNELGRCAVAIPLSEDSDLESVQLHCISEVSLPKVLSYAGGSEHLVTKYDPQTSFVLEIALCAGEAMRVAQSIVMTQNGERLHHCEYWRCFAVEPEPGTFCRCGLCKVTYYCSKECQRKHLKAHKQFCKAMAQEGK